MASQTPLTASSATAPGPRSWLERLWSSVADRGRPYADVLQPEASVKPIERAREFASALLSERGEASGAAVARELHSALSHFGPDDRLAFYRFLVADFLPDDARLRTAIEAYLKAPTPENATAVSSAAEPTRQELLRRMNMSPGGTASLIAMRRDLLAHLRDDPSLQPLEYDLRHLLASWFNRGFLELRRIDWQTPAAVLAKLITYEAVHEIQGWEDLRRRLASDRRCFGFFHPALPGEPLIFVEVALTQGLAASVQPLLVRDGDEAAERQRERAADTAIFYSISNCQDGLQHLLWQFPDQAGRRGAEGRAAWAGAVLDAVAGAGLSPLAGEAAGGRRCGPAVRGRDGGAPGSGWGSGPAGQPWYVAAQPARCRALVGGHGAIGCAAPTAQAALRDLPHHARREQVRRQRAA